MTEYIYLSEYDSNGVPQTLNLDELSNDISKTIKSSVLTEIDTVLKEEKSVLINHPDWVKSHDIHFNSSSELTVTFVEEGAGYKNAFGYYVYDTDSPPSRFGYIDKIGIIFPNASKTGSGGKMSPGDTMKIPYTYTTKSVDGKTYVDTVTSWSFPANKSVGFVVFANGWKDDHVRINTSMFSSNPNINPEPIELKQHFVAFRPENTDIIVYGVEDINRTKSYCDHDFNDLIYFVTPTPITAVDIRSYNYTTQRYEGTFLCEDLSVQKTIQDRDYNDFVGEYYIEEKLDVNYDIQSIECKLVGLHRGASYDHSFGFVIPNIKTKTGTIFVEEYVSSTDESTFRDISADVFGSGTDRVKMIDSTKHFLPKPINTDFSNTIIGETQVEPSYVRMKITFDSPVPRADILNTQAPYEFFLQSWISGTTSGKSHYYYSNDIYDNVSSELQSIGVTKKEKILILKDFINFRVPLERKKLVHAFPYFLRYLQSNRLKFRNWYENPNTSRTYPYITHIDLHTWNDVFNETL